MKVSLMALVAAFCLVVGLPLAAMAGPTPGLSADGDGDGVENAFDNCSATSNASQKDVDHDGCGDLCDMDVASNNGTTGLDDFGLLAAAFGSSTGQPAFVPLADINCNGAVGLDDFGLLASRFGINQGPSGITNPGRNFTACP
jgi:hypothetical protein